ncbi:hypothetical protein EAF04_009005 [Stromatinia cepivora]|nr:hypothetical protein EAF04_009005 [Stromatinia cepivora]
MDSSTTSSTTSSKITIKDWLEQKLQWNRFQYSKSGQRRSAGNPVYRELGEHITIEKWDDFTVENISQLKTLASWFGEDLDKKDDLTPTTLPIILDDELVLSNEASLVYVLGLSLFYNVKIVLRRIYSDTPITVMVHVPFSSASLQDDSLKRQVTYTPDYSVFQGGIYENPTLIDNTVTALAVGDVKFSPVGNGSDDASGDKSPPRIGKTFRGEDIGQLLWYCCQRRTRFAFCVSNAELIIVQFTCDMTKVSPKDNDGNIVEIFGNVVTEAMSETEGSLRSSQQRGGSEGVPSDSSPLSQRSQPSPTTGHDDSAKDGPAALTTANTHKRTESNTSGDSATVSPTSRHLQKKARAETFTPDMQESSSPLLSLLQPSRWREVTPPSPSPLPDADSPTTSEGAKSSSSGYQSSSPYTVNGGLSTDTMRKLSDVAGGFTARVSTLDLNAPKGKQAPLEIVGLVALASLAESSGALDVSKQWVDLRDYCKDT